MVKKIVIVGGVAGGASAAARLRRISEDVEIVMFERGEYISFANCGLPYFIGETIKERNELIVQTVEGMAKKFNMTIRTLSEVMSINRKEQTVTVKNLKTGEIYDETYDRLLLSPGAKPIVPTISGMDENESVFTLRNIPDTDRIKSFVDERKPKKAVVVGGGFIGIEMAENLHRRGLDVTIVEMAQQTMTPIDYEMACLLHNHIREKGVKLVLENGVKAFQDRGKKIVLSDGTILETDLTILSIGVQPENDLAKKAELSIGEKGGIIVNEYLQTSDENIYAVGDAIEVTNVLNGEKTQLPLAGPANRQGRIAANNMMGKREKYEGVLGTSIAKVFDLTVAVTGNNEKTLKRLGISYEVIHIHPLSHAGYYPGAMPINLKFIFDKETGKIYGAQAVGMEGVDKRIDVLATAIKGGLTVEDLTNVELAYAPPYSSAKDPVNMAGYVASNIRLGDLEQIQWYDVDQVKHKGIIIDVREEEELTVGKIEGSFNIPLGQLREKISLLPKQQPIYVYCQVGLRGYIAYRILKSNGFNVKNIDGGWMTYAAYRSDQMAKSQQKREMVI
ncbi:CoA-disulfide reductase [Fervidibacillus halotolerans]|uniref:CoA-disulfide reductase n=1 Tax=Fervidibacillus halotolerans TaxID=2980027 RepID=A0A9E8M246_9BACI|nr:CoA-disulfide reductase [Fervidibacillus halotolerans]WAA13535.1 CoA-disulfide reductase [Fervidibacillus halotolerans]